MDVTTGAGGVWKKKITSPRKKKSFRTPPGTAPGAFVVPEDALTPKVKIFSYDSGSFEEKEVTGVLAIKSQVENFPDKNHWIDIRGFGDKVFFEQVADCFGIHRLQMEDVFNVYQRAKVEEYQGHLFFISRCLKQENGIIVNDQLSLFLGKNFIISIQDKYEDLLDPVRDRIRQGKGNARNSGTDYLAYALMDAVLDNFFPIIERISDRLDELQDALIDNPTRELLNSVLQTKRDLILLRRAIWSERDKVNDILRSGFLLVTDSTKIFFRDSYDHCVHVLDLVESYKEVTASLMDVYMSSVSNKMNQVMKVLTIISTIFIPLTFIVGLYGMNFAYTNPKTGEDLPLNMPELYSPYGYITVNAIMLLIVIGLVIFFIRKGWLTKGN
ncbi:magnesium/cobalt transporter CorA [soil metagenome]